MKITYCEKCHEEKAHIAKRAYKKGFDVVREFKAALLEKSITDMRQK